MAEFLPVAGFFRDRENDKFHSGTIRIFAWHAPEFGRKDAELNARPKLMPLRSIMVERRVSTNAISKPTVMWSNGEQIHTWEQQLLSKRIRNLIRKAKKETLRMAGGGV